MRRDIVQFHSNTTDSPKNRARTWRGALLCVVVYLACLLIAWPVAEMGFVDDWSYIKTAQLFAQTGHLVYNGWGAPMLGWQAAWGALFIRIFGFSFMAVKISMLPISVGCIVLFYFVLLHFGVNTRIAVIGTLTLALSPIFLPLSVSFMTDIPGLFAILACLYLCLRAVDSAKPGATILWLGLATVVSLLIGTSRQTGWLGALVMVPACGVLLRQRRRVLPASLSFGLVSLTVVLLCMDWLHRQPYWIANDLSPDLPASAWSEAVLAIFEVVGFVISLMLILSPVLVPWLARARSLKGRGFALGSVLLFIAALMGFAAGRPIPWIPHMFSSEFWAHQAVTGREEITHSPISMVISLCALLTLTSATLVFLSLTQFRPLKSKNHAQKAIEPQMAWLILPYCCAYFILILPRAFHGEMFDRWALGLVPVAILPIYQLFQARASSTLTAISIATLALMAALSVAGTHDSFAWQRARIKAIAELNSKGVPRTEVYAGLDFDGWTQIEQTGFVNNPFLENPPGVFRPNANLTTSGPCSYRFASYLPSIRAEYTIIFPPEPCFKRSQLPPVRYTSWIPPFRRTIYVQRIPPKAEGDRR